MTWQIRWPTAGPNAARPTAFAGDDASRLYTEVLTY
jgi:hypothetical protein